MEAGVDPITSSRADAAVEVAGLRVRRGGRAVLEDLSLHIASARITGLLGPSGCGKTTLMRAIVGVQRISGGVVRVLGEPAGSPALRHRVAYGTQGAAVYADLSVRENLQYFARVLGVGGEAVDRTIDTVGLTAEARRRVSELSGGQINRVSLGIALLGGPELLVLDEPTVGLDPVLRADLWTLLHDLAAAGTTLLVSSHVMDEALRCDRLLLMREGRLLADTTPTQLLSTTGQSDAETAFLTLIQRDASERGIPRPAAQQSRRALRERRRW